MSLQRIVYFGLALMAMRPTLEPKLPHIGLHSNGGRNTGIAGHRFRSAGQRDRSSSEKHLGVHSLLVIRHGYAVSDVTFYPYDGATPHDWRR